MTLAQLFDNARIASKNLNCRFSLTVVLAFLYLEGNMSPDEALICEKYFEKRNINMMLVLELYTTNSIEGSL